MRGSQAFRPGGLVWCLCFLTPVSTISGQSPGREAAGQPAQLRITVTGPDYNRPRPFPGLGEFGWSGNLVRQPDGELLLVHSAGYYHVSFAQPHQIEPELRRRWKEQGWPLQAAAPTGGRSMLVRSRDGGRSWSRPVTVIDLPWDDAPYGLLRCSDGTLLCFINVQASWYGYERAPAGFENQLDGLNTRQCVVRSEDHGRTWSDPIWLESPGDHYERSHAQPLVLSSGRILWPTYYRNADDPRLYGAIHYSDNQGATWGLLATVQRAGDVADVASDDAANVDEPAVTSLADGSLLMVVRPDGGRFRSRDGGETWTSEGRLVTTGKLKAPRLFVLRDGTIVCVCTYRNLQVFLGTPDGRQWQGPFDLDGGSYGYPGGIICDDDSIIVSYCSSGRAPNSIYLLRFRVNTVRSGIELLPVGKSPDDLRPVIP